MCSISTIWHVIILICYEVEEEREETLETLQQRLASVLKHDEEDAPMGEDGWIQDEEDAAMDREEGSWEEAEEEDEEKDPEDERWRTGLGTENSL